MPLMIQFHDDLACPTIVCDWCQQPITDAREGGYFWPQTCREAGTTVPVIFLHKGRCDTRYQGAHGPLDCWHELRDLPGYLVRNLAHTCPEPVSIW